MFWYNVDTVFYQFLQTGTSIRIHIGRDQLLKCSGFSVYHFSFFLYCPFKSMLPFIFSLKSLKSMPPFIFPLQSL